MPIPQSIKAPRITEIVDLWQKESKQRMEADTKVIKIIEELSEIVKENTKIMMPEKCFDTMIELGIRQERKRIMDAIQKEEIICPIDVWNLINNTNE